jgi:predicted enzyme related to lactoylglutathione lyase
LDDLKKPVSSAHAQSLLTLRRQQAPCMVKPLQFNAQEEDTVNLVSMRVITNDMKRLVSFYEDISGLTATWYTEDFAELATPSCTLAIGSTRTMALFGSEAAHAADNHSVIIEFRVDDVDKAYASLSGAIGDVVQEPKTMPWGNRSLLFRDPDGNLVNFFTPVSAEAIKKHNPRGQAAILQP